MSVSGACPKCGHFVKCGSSKGQAETRCPGCKVRVIFVNGQVAGWK